MAIAHHHQGPIFRDFVARMVQSKRARTYLEIGVRDGSTLVLVDCASIGVDPSFQFTLNPMGKKPSLHLFQMTSDEFFKSHDVVEILGRPLDVVFLDGLHQFEYLLRDFYNSERSSHRDGLIMLDDCLPVNSEMTERTHNPAGRANQDLASWWTGDVWKMLPILRKFRPDLQIALVDTSPTGNVCVVNLDPTSTVLRDRYFDIVAEFAGIAMDDQLLVQLYRDNHVVEASTILSGFDASLTIGG